MLTLASRNNDQYFIQLTINQLLKKITVRPIDNNNIVFCMHFTTNQLNVIRF